ncbi:RES family NAD+ phosphorylase [Flavihumibacter solisilvae]|uniref:RES superfamily protein n=1 Tax=Flavihumibacter solisilvae TaxID=1349421 RepID=A0A0C1IJP3_9BACT|nr:RES family NAD+ phosphorylase [Flavihumibacter solisilvae]KIC94400.1 RES superfamily protein [Flavihumibacter solisilvae]
MEVYRLAREKFAGSLSGKGAAISGARWNSVGIEMIYTAANRSLAMAEVAVHLTLATLPTDFMMLTIQIPEDVSVLELDTEGLPANWSNFPHIAATQKLGDQFVLENRYCVLQVPSAVTRGDYNYLINPGHADFKRIKIIGAEKFPFDHRIFK